MSRPREDWFQQVQCAGKEQMTPGWARSVARRMRRRGSNASAYHCPSCGAWHVGSRPALLKTGKHQRRKLLERQRAGEAQAD